VLAEADNRSPSGATFVDIRSPSGVIFFSSAAAMLVGITIFLASWIATAALTEAPLVETGDNNGETTAGLTSLARKLFTAVRNSCCVSFVANR
jgi:hypothetical protein